MLFFLQCQPSLASVIIVFGQLTLQLLPQPRFECHRCSRKSVKIFQSVLLSSNQSLPQNSIQTVSLSTPSGVYLAFRQRRIRHAACTCWRKHPTAVKVLWPGAVLSVDEVCQRIKKSFICLTASGNGASFSTMQLQTGTGRLFVRYALPDCNMQSKMKYCAVYISFTYRKVDSSSAKSHRKE